MYAILYELHVISLGKISKIGYDRQWNQVVAQNHTAF